MEDIRTAASNHQSNPIKPPIQSQLSSLSIQDSDTLTVSTLPHDLINEILLRLPVKSLVKFKCVSRSWLSLISSHQFIRAHFKFNSSTDNQRVLILSCVGWDYCFKHCSLNSLLYAQVTDAIDVDYPPFDAPLNLVSVVGCSGGMICIAIRATNLFLWNPSTLKSKKLPDLGIRLKEDSYYIACGFGYDEINDDYKVVAVVVILDDHDEPSSTLVMVCSTESGSWRRIGDFQGGFPLEEYGKFVNGKLHWSLDKEDYRYIGSLDLATEIYGKVEKPNYDKDSYSDSGLESDHDSDSESTLDGEVLLFLGSKLVLYNPGDVSYGDISFRDQQITSYYAFVYTESLALPTVNNATERQQQQLMQVLLFEQLNSAFMAGL
ncbi:hypothetical protein ACH5RR_031737 [Cinchona calisaya]|uniref:F-box domain-containing protein n=1 Tax=Cinchona calisaya TaxID=153742 RepID=A0ABD2YJI4_9GENT